MKFSFVASMFDAIERESARTRITELLAELFTATSPREAARVAYLSLGMLRPPYEGTQFGIADKTMRAVVAGLLGQSIPQVTAGARDVGDLGAYLATYTWERSIAHELTVDEVYDQLCALQDISGMGSSERKMSLLIALLAQLDVVSAKYVVRMVLDTLRLGFSDMTLLDAFSVMQAGDKSLRKRLEHAYNITADIGHIARVLKADGMEGIDKIHIIVGIPVRPALAERLEDATAIMDKLGACVAQQKLDGFRLQVHLQHEPGGTPIVRFFSRNLQNMSEMFPELQSQVAAIPAHTVIFEGEAIAYDVETGSFLPFQETVTRKRKHDIVGVAASVPLKLYLFDLLWYNGVSYLDKPHHERRAQLAHIIATAQQPDIMLIEERAMHTAAELEHYFEEEIAAGLEGVVVKKIDAPYVPGKRNFNWVKLKRQETGHLDDTIDCVIVGYYAGHGKRAAFGIGAVLVAVYNPARDMFETIAKIGTGFTDDEWREVKKKCDQHQVTGKPHNLDCARELYPDVWVTPEIVCAIRADEITRSPLHTAAKLRDQEGLALRFPRFMGYRSDKSATDATTSEEVREMFGLQKKYRAA